MATPTSPQKRLMALGAIKAAAWGTALPLTAAGGILYLKTTGIVPKRPNYPSLEADTPMVREGDLGAVDAVNFSIDFEMRYDPGMLGTLIALFFGTAGAPTKVGATLAYKHVLQFADNVEGKFATVVIERPGKIYEVASAKVIGLSFSVSEGILKGTLRLRGNTCIDDSAINTATQIDALTYVDRENRIQYVQGLFKMNAQLDGDVTGATALQVNDISIDLDRPHDAVLPAGQDYIAEPIENGHPAFSLKLGFPRFNSVNAAFLATLKAGTEQKALLKLTGALIEAGFYYDLAFYFPRLRMVDFTPGEDEIIKNGLELVGEEAAANPTGMIYKRLYVEMVNKQTTDYLA